MESFNCIYPSTDENNEFIFVGHNGNIECIDAAAMSSVDKVYLNESSNIIGISTVKLKQQAHLVVSFTDVGAFYMHLFVINKFYAIQALIEHVSL